MGRYKSVGQKPRRERIHLNTPLIEGYAKDAKETMVTIMTGNVPIGGIRVSGAAGGQYDEECARLAIAKIQDRIK